MIALAGFLVLAVWLMAAIAVLGLTSLAGELIVEEGEPPRPWLDAGVALVIIMSLSVLPLVMVVLMRVP